MTAPNNVAFPCASGRKDALVAYRGFFNPQAIRLRFVTCGQVIDYVDDPPLPGGNRPPRPVNAKALADFLTDAGPAGALIPIDRDLDGQWLGEQRVRLVYRVNGPHDPAIVALTREDAARLAAWMREVAELPTPD